jgi:hypothetical protein
MLMMILMDSIVPLLLTIFVYGGCIVSVVLLVLVSRELFNPFYAVEYKMLGLSLRTEKVLGCVMLGFAASLGFLLFVIIFASSS